MQGHIINLVPRRFLTLLIILLITASQLGAAETNQPAITTDNNSDTCQVSEETLNRLVQVIQLGYDTNPKIDIRMPYKPVDRCSLIENIIIDIYNYLGNNTLKLKNCTSLVSKIENQDYISAFAHYRNFCDVSQLSQIVSSAYDQDIDNLSNIIKFISFMDSCQLQAVAYQELYEVVKRNKHLRHPKILYFANVKEECMSISLRNEIDEYITEIIKGFVSDYTTGNLYEALEFDKIFPQNKVSARYVIYSKLFELLKNNQLNGTELVTLAYRLRALDLICATKNHCCSKHVKSKLSNFKLQIPSGIRASFWNSYVTIESKLQDGYVLCSPSNGSVHTYPTNSLECNQKWFFRPISDGRYFEIANVEDGTKLYGEGDKLFAGEYRGYAGHWQIFYVSHGSYYVLRNRASGRALDAARLKKCASSFTSQCGSPWAYYFNLENDFQKWFIH